MKILTHILRAASFLLLGGISLTHPLFAEEAYPHSWMPVFQISPPSSINALADLGDGVVLVGTRGAASAEGQAVSGRIAVSHDFGRTWKEYGRVIDGQIVCLAALDSQTVLASTSTGEIWKSVDQGKSWQKTKRIADVPLYGMLVTDQGTVLVSNYDLENPGHVYRSTDKGETWSDLGRLSLKGLYRFQKVRDGIILNGMAGHIFKSTDDGLVWADIGQVSAEMLHPIEALPDGVALTGDEHGRVFRSTDDGLTWKEVARLEQPLDDFVWIHEGLVYLSAYKGTKHLFVSHDGGATWSDIGSLPDGDVLDHAIRLQDSQPPTALGGTVNGRILRLGGTLHGKPAASQK